MSVRERAARFAALRETEQAAVNDSDAPQPSSSSSSSSSPPSRTSRKPGACSPPAGTTSTSVHPVNVPLGAPPAPAPTQGPRRSSASSSPLTAKAQSSEVTRERGKGGLADLKPQAVDSRDGRRDVENLAVPPAVDPIQSMYCSGAQVLFRRRHRMRHAEMAAPATEEESAVAAAVTPEDGEWSSYALSHHSPTSAMISSLLQREGRVSGAPGDREMPTTATETVEMIEPWQWELGTVLALRGEVRQAPSTAAPLVTSTDVSSRASPRDARTVLVVPQRCRRECFVLDLAEVRPFPYAGSLFHVSDVAELPLASDAALVHALHRRFQEGLHYTYVGAMLVAVNPYASCDYPPDAPHPRRLVASVQEYLRGGGKLGSEEPHGGGVGSAYDAAASPRVACVVVTGESGSGKTETIKLALSTFLKPATVEAASRNRIVALLDAVAPIVESFGNARTAMNGNSSRFTKCVTVYADRVTQEPIYAQIDCVLLEVSRVVGRNAGEGNFHLLHMLFSDMDGLTHEERSTFDVWDPSLFLCMYSGAAGEMQQPSPMGRSNSNWIDPVEKSRPSLATARGQLAVSMPPFTLTQFRLALRLVGATVEQERGLLRVLCGILHLLNVEFVAEDAYSPAGVTSAAAASCAKAASLLGFASGEGVAAAEPRQASPEAGSSSAVQPPSPPSLEVLLTSVRLGKEVRQLHCSAAYATRDSLAKFLYDALFRFAVALINSSLEKATGDGVSSSGADRVTPPSRVADACVMVDMFGFEKLDKPLENGLEQLLINYTNEAVQALYEESTFDAFRADAEREGVQLAMDEYARRGSAARAALFPSVEVPASSDGTSGPTAASPSGATPVGSHPSPAGDGSSGSAECMALLTGRPHGILHCINDDSVLSQQTRTGGDHLAAKILALSRLFPKHLRPNRTDPTKFLVRHYCGWVEYGASCVSARNRLSTSVSHLCDQHSRDPFVQRLATLFVQSAEDPKKRVAGDGMGSLGYKVHPLLQQCRSTGGRLAFTAPGAGQARGGSSSGAAQAPTLIAAFRQQVDGLLSALKQSEVFWIRCVKPNADCSPRRFSHPLVAMQLSYCGVEQALRVSGDECCRRFTHRQFVRRWLQLAFHGYVEQESRLQSQEPAPLSPTSPVRSGAGWTKARQQLRQSFEEAIRCARFRDACGIAARLLPCCMDDALLLGTSKVFVKAETLRNLERLGDAARLRTARLLQAAGRGLQERRWLSRQLFDARKERLTREIQLRIQRELPVRLKLEEEREELLGAVCAGRAEELAVLSRRACRLSARAMTHWEHAVTLIDSELQQAMTELGAFEAARLAREREIVEDRQLARQCAEEARAAIQREVQQRAAAQQQQRARFLAQEARRADIQARRAASCRREEEIRRAVLLERQRQLRVERRVEAERQRLKQRSNLIAETRVVREHMRKQQQRIIARAELHHEIEQRHAQAAAEAERLLMRRRQRYGSGTGDNSDIDAWLDDQRVGHVAPETISRSTDSSDVATPLVRRLPLAVERSSSALRGVLADTLAVRSPMPRQPYGHDALLPARAPHLVVRGNRRSASLFHRPSPSEGQQWAAQRERWAQWELEECTRDATIATP